MENFTEPLSNDLPADRQLGNDESPASPEATIFYPPKYEKQDQTANIWLKSFTSLAAYLLLGYFIFPSYKILLVITAIVMIHELGHFFAMKFFGYNDLGIFFIPLLGAYVSGTKREVSQKQSAIILLAGPLPGIILGSAFYLIDNNSTGHYFFDISLSRIGLLFIILNLINLFPVYPLDGGQLLNRVFLDEESLWSKVFVFLSAGLMCWFAWSMYSSSHNSLYFSLLLFPLMMLLRLSGEKKITNIEKRIEAEGIHLDLEYKHLPDEDYWKIRNILIEEHTPFKDVTPAPPYEFSSKEEKIMTTIQSLLHRHLIQDISIAGKIFIFLIWAAGIAAPWLLKMDMSFFNHFGLRLS
jgi:Zn-dependent protease